LANYASRNLDPILGMMQDPNAVIGLGDGGAHYGMISDSSYPTFVLQHWTRDRAGARISVERAIQSLTSVPAATVGLHDRGVIAVGRKADLNVIDHDRLFLPPPSVVHDLPAGGRRLFQGADGYDATLVAGQVIMREGKPTGALPGKLVRGAQAAPA